MGAGSGTSLVVIEAPASSFPDEPFIVLDLVSFKDDAAEVGVQVRFQIGGDERLPILGAEDDVSDVLMEGTGHGGAMVENVEKACPCDPLCQSPRQSGALRN